jgi:uncharacterized protein
MVPFLILGACVLLGIQERVKRWLVGRGRIAVPDGQSPTLAVKAAVFGAAVYGGYFGAGLGIMLLAVLGLALDDSLIRVNALKQAVSLVVNVLAACFFVFSGRVHWTFAVIMAVTSLLGGSVGGRVVRHFKPALLRSVVVVFGVVVAVRFLV